VRISINTLAINTYNALHMVRYILARETFCQKKEKSKAMQSQETIAAIILAAGSSSRMGAGRHKLFLPLGERPVLVHVLEAALAAQTRPIVLVLGYQAAQAHALLSPYLHVPDLQIIENSAYQQGMSTSLRAGLQALTDFNAHAAQEHTGGAIILLGDQPLITTRIIDSLVAAWRTAGKRIIAPLYNGKRGNPVLFSADLFTELANVTGDEGGRSVIERHRQEVATVEMEDAQASFDVDTWEAYQQVVAEWQQKQGK
jgi:molybdenum cofactor cytidylyltransferase